MTVQSFPGVFGADEVKRIRDLGDAARAAKGTVNGAPAEIRDCSVVPLEDAWLRSALWGAVNAINDKFYHFDLTDTERPQYIRYGVRGHYGWHLDSGPLTQAPRKLSFTVQLSSPDEYCGGEFQIWNGHRPQTMPAGQGTLIAFPSWLLHRVKPVTSGERRALVVWANGPEFR